MYVAYSVKLKTVPGLGPVSYCGLRRVPVGTKRPVGAASAAEREMRRELGEYPSRAKHIARRIAVGNALLTQGIAAEVVDQLVAGPTAWWRSAERAIEALESLDVIGRGDIVRDTW